MTFTPAELTYLEKQPLGRLATVDADGAPQNNPVAFFVDADGMIFVGGMRMGQTRKFRNVARGSDVALVVDDVASVDPWTPRMIEIRGTAEALTDQVPPRPGFSREVIRIHPKQIYAFGVDPHAEGM